ncbi:capsid protein VP1 [Trichonephila clavipes]|nr:capsid protein VP1 [Trichonephila clavipes]
MYLNPSEYALLPEASCVVKVSCKVTAENIRIAFPTNESGTKLAILNQNKFIRIGENLMLYLPSINVKYTKFEDNNPMVPAELKVFERADLEAFAIAMYGKAFLSKDDYHKTIPHHQVGIPQTLPMYLNVVSDHECGFGWPDIQSYCTEINVENASGVVVANVTYEPHAGYLRKPPRSHTIKQFDKCGDAVTTTAEVRNRIDSDADIGYRNIIEKSQTLCRGLYEGFKPETQPSLHVGVQPVPSLTSTDIGHNVTKFTDCQGYFTVECEMIVRCESDTYRPFAMFENVPHHEELRKFDVPGPNTSRSMYYGLYQQ